jgi:hypothetical protein
MNINNRLKKLESEVTSSNVCVCVPGVWIERIALDEPGKSVSLPDNCSRCGKPMNESMAKIIVPAKLSPEKWAEQWNASKTE